MAKKNGKGGSNTKPSEAAVRDLREKIKKLEARTKQTGKKPKVSLKSQKGKSSGPPVSVLSSFARGFLDPFGASEVRVPDTFLSRTATSFSRQFAGGPGGAPSYNFTTANVYGTIISAPLWNTSASPFHYSFTPTSARSFFNYDNVATGPQAIDYTKNFGDVNIASATGILGTGIMAKRVSGGGVRISFYGIQPQTPVDLYAVPMFNGDTVMSQWENVANQRVRHWRMTGDDTVVVPWCVRHTGEAFEWVTGLKTGASATDYPADDGVSTANIPSAFSTAVAADRTSTNCAISAWSLQSGLGGWQFAFNLPPGAGWRVETIVFIEAQMGQTNTSYYGSDKDSKPSLCDMKQLETVCNLASLTALKETTMNGGVESPWEDLRAQLGNATLNTLTEAVKENKLIEKTLMYGLGKIIA